MANHCANKIVFSGENLSLIRNLFDEIRKENGDNYGWSPEGYTTKGFYRCLFDVDITDNEYEIIFECWTKWSPPTDEMLYLCFGNVNFSIEYEEVGMEVFGKCFYDSETNTFDDIYLTDEDFKRVECNEDSEWTFDGNVIESRYDAFEQMLNDKLN
jgi:hypothetical protein